MKKYLYAYRNKLGGFFGNVFTDDHEPAVYAESLQQSMFGATIEQLGALCEDELYCLGTYDNLSGIVIAENTFILDVSAIVARLVLLKKAQSMTNEEDSKHE